MMITAGGKEPVGQGLGKHVGELRNGQIGDKDFLEGSMEVLDNSGGLFFLECLFDDVPYEMRQAGKPLRQVFGLVDGRGLPVEKRCKKLIYVLLALLVGDNLPTLAQASKRGCLAMFALNIPTKLQIVGEDEVAQREVTLDLLRPFRFIQRFANVFGLNVADGEGAMLGRSGNDIVWRTALNPLRLIRGGDALFKRLYENFKSWAMRVLCRVSALEVFSYGFEISVEWHGFRLGQRLRTSFG
ncbi:MAG: hypothetical protein RX318_09895 [bacterium]|nr:hypothetical protein [bacterium]